jgi:hypothetical protein
MGGGSTSRSAQLEDSFSQRIVDASLVQALGDPAPANRREAIRQLDYHDGDLPEAVVRKLREIAESDPSGHVYLAARKFLRDRGLLEPPA